MASCAALAVTAGIAAGVTAAQADIAADLAPAAPAAPAATTAAAGSKAGYVATIENVVLWLVSPTGVNTRVTAAPDSDLHLADVSRNGTRFLFTAPINDESTRIAAYDSLKGAWSSFTTSTVGSDIIQARFTAPSAASIWLGRQRPDGQAPFTERRSVSGALELSVPGASSVLPAPDGLTFATDEGGGRIRVRATATGALVRTLPAVTGRRCTPLSNWDAARLTAICWNDAAMRMDVYRFAWAGGALSALTRASAPFGFDGAWRTSKGIVASDAVQGTGDGIGFAPRPGSYTAIKASFATWGMAHVQTAIGSKVYVMGTPSPDPTLSAMYAYDLGTGKTLLLGSNASVVVDPLR